MTSNWFLNTAQKNRKKRNNSFPPFFTLGARELKPQKSSFFNGSAIEKGPGGGGGKDRAIKEKRTFFSDGQSSDCH